MQLQIIKTTDGRHLGQIIDSPAESFGQMTMREIQALAASHFDGQFEPDFIQYQLPNQVRLVSSNYSATLRRVI